MTDGKAAPMMMQFGDPFFWGTRIPCATFGLKNTQILLSPFAEIIFVREPP